MESLKESFVYIMTPSAPVFIVGAIIVLLVPLLVHLFVARTTPYTSLPSILVAGPTGAGKTSLLTLLERGDKNLPTHTSQVPQSVELTVSKGSGTTLSYREAAREDAPGTHKKFLLVDTPGHGKLRNHAMNRIATRENLRGILFMLDASALSETLPDTANYLYEVLLALQKRMGVSTTSKAPHAIHVLVAANKTDLFTASPASLVKSNLEAELSRVRQSRSKGMLDSGVGGDEVGNDQTDQWLGEYGAEKFLFSQMREFDVEVEVVGGSVLEGNADRWWDWISGRV